MKQFLSILKNFTVNTRHNTTEFPLVLGVAEAETFVGVGRTVASVIR